MSKTARNACLFGGALLSAGIHTAALADFVIVTTDHNGGITPGPYAYSYTLTPSFMSDFEIGGGVGPTSASSSLPGAGMVDVVINADQITGDMSEEPNLAFGYFAFNTNFGVDVETDITITWELDSGIEDANKVFELRDVTNFTTLFEYNPITNANSGSIELTLMPGNEYRVEALARAFVGTSNASFRITQPVCPSADLNGDGVVDSSDLALLIGQFGDVCE